MPPPRQTVWRGGQQYSRSGSAHVSFGSQQIEPHLRPAGHGFGVHAAEPSGGALQVQSWSGEQQVS